jgi:dTDP-4-amino-4,6-dideoxygalactose transaminase
MSLFSQGIAALASKSRITQNRRRNYATLLAALGNLPGGKPLFPTLPEGVVPQVFPVLMDEPARIFALLKHQGVPIIRFGEFPWPAMPASRCTDSTELSRRVFQFPCHQDLTPGELDWMIGCIRDTLLGH